MATNRDKRLDKEKAAAAFLERHHDPLAKLLIEVVGDLGSELTGLPALQRDARLASEMAYRLDSAIPFPDELVESLDYFGFFLVSLLCIGIYRAIERKTERRQRRVSTLERKLKERGPKMAKARRRAIERRINKLKAT